MRHWRWPEWRLLLICLLLAAGTTFVFFQTRSFEFTNYDDDEFVSANPIVQQGLSIRGVSWALATGYTGTWIPVTWLSHMIACDLFGLRSGAHHLVNVALHVASACLLFLLLRRLTGAAWRSAMVAAVFAWHPLHVESVAWVAERKDVLSGLFFVLTLFAYVKYVAAHDAPSSSEAGQGTANPSSSWYGLSILAFALGLMSKPMLVTLPFVLLLLDLWPLNRVARSESVLPRLVNLAREKLPFFALSLVGCWATAAAQKEFGGLQALGHLPFLTRLGNALVSYVRYLGKAFFPADLAVPYPYPPPWPAWMVLGALLFLILCSIFAIISMRRRPWLAVGWFWFVGMLVPVIGIIQTGPQALADRYTYLPLIGLAIAIVWQVSDWASTFPRCRLPVGVLGALILCSCLFLSCKQTAYWRNSVELFSHSVQATRNNVIAHYNLGQALHARGGTQEAMVQYREALELNPQHVTAHLNLGILLADSGQLQEATNHLFQAVQLRPGYSLAHFRLAKALAGLRDWPGAEAQFQAAAKVEPENPLLHQEWGFALLEEGKLDSAAEHFTHALVNAPFLSRANLGLGLVLSKQGHKEAAIERFSEALRLDPACKQAATELAELHGAKEQEDRSK